MSAGYIRDTKLPGCDVFADALFIHLEDEEEDHRVFTATCVDENNKLLLAAGGHDDNGIYVLPLQSLLSLAREEKDELRGAMSELTVDPAKKHGVHRIAVQPSPARQGSPLGVLYSSDNGWEHSVKCGVERSGHIHTTQYFDGHRGKVLDLAVPSHFSRHDPFFMSTSEDGTVCLWAMASPSRPLFRWRCNTYPAAAFDSTGCVVAITHDSSTVHLYDLRKLAQDWDKHPSGTVPFASLPTGLPLNEYPQSLQFHPYVSSSAPKENLYITGQRYEKMSKFAWSSHTDGVSCVHIVNFSKNKQK